MLSQNTLSTSIASTFYPKVRRCGAVIQMQKVFPEEPVSQAHAKAILFSIPLLHWNLSLCEEEAKVAEIVLLKNNLDFKNLKF